VNPRALSPGWLERQRDSLERRLAEQSKDLGPLLATPRLDSLRSFLWLVDEWLRDLARESGVPEARAVLLAQCVLHGALPALARYRGGDARAAADWIALAWFRHAVALGALPPCQDPLWEPAPPPAPLPAETELEFLASYQLAAAELLSTRLQDAQGRMILRRLMTHLGLSFDDLARAFQVPAVTVRRWESRQEEIPADRVSELRQAEAALGRLFVVFRPERLAYLIRRKAEIFHGEQALDLILRGRFAAVADLYESALSYEA